MNQKVIVFLLSLVLGSFHLTSRAQDNYFVSEGDMQLMTQTADGGFIGVNNGNLVKTDVDFNMEWAKDYPFAQVHDLCITSSGDIALVGEYADGFMFCRVGPTGDLITSKRMAVPDPGQAVIENLGNDLVFAMYMDSAEGFSWSGASLILMATDQDFVTTWSKTITDWSTTYFGYNHLDLAVDNDSIFLLTRITNLQMNIIAKFDGGGNEVWTRHIGNNCSRYSRMAILPNKEIVIAGQGSEEPSVIRISVLSPLGAIVHTKTRSASDNTVHYPSRVVAYPDNRYAIAYNHTWGGAGSDFANKILFFDNHEYMGAWRYRELGLGYFPWDERLYLWGLDNENRLLVSGYQDDGDTEEDRMMGKVVWMSEDCGVGNIPTMWSYDYIKEPTESIVLGMTDISLAVEDTAITFTDGTYSNTFKCSNAGFDPGAVATDDHLYGDTTWTYMCSYTIYGDGTNPDPDYNPSTDDTTSTDTTTTDTTIVDTTGAFILSEDKPHFVIYPNPAKESVTILAPLQAEIFIYDMKGRMVFNRLNTKDKLIVDLSTLEKGVYLVLMKRDRDQFVRKRLVVH